MNRTQRKTKNFFCFEVENFETKAPNGKYLAISSERCECCEEQITTELPIQVKNGFAMPQSLIKAGSALAERHPTHPYLEAAEWQGDGSFLLHFGS